MNKNRIQTAPRKNPPCTKQRSGSLHLTQKADYGLLLMTSLSESKEHTSIQQIAKDQNLSFSFLQKIAGMLQKSGIIKAIRGKFGGYILAKPAKILTLKEIFESLEGKISILPCLTRNCAISRQCKIKAGLKKLTNEIQDHFLTKTLSEFINNYTK